jgi:hypothetical protein
MFNTELAIDILGHIVASERAGTKQWSQNTWCKSYPEHEPVMIFDTTIKESNCGTAFCYAGWAVALSKGKFHMDKYGEATFTTVAPFTAGVSIGRAARALLRIKDYGLDEYSYHDLFAADNGLDELYEYTAYYAKMNEHELTKAVTRRANELLEP